MAKNNKDFQDFLRDEVNLNQSRLDRLNTSVRAVDAYLKDHLTGYQKMERQGSYALGTLIKPVDDNDEYDADIQIVMNPNSKWQAKDYINEVHRTRGYVNRCVNDIRRRPSQPLIQWRFHPHTVHLDRRLRSTQGPSDA